ncbi:hypothetical protein As57867_015499, partial [Aphanomyces stellatus]
EPTTANVTTVAPNATLDAANTTTSDNATDASSVNGTSAFNHLANSTNETLTITSPDAIVASVETVNGDAGGAPPASTSTSGTKINGGGDGTTKIGGMGAAEESSGSGLSYMLVGTAFVGCCAVAAMIVYNRRKAQLEEDKDDAVMYPDTSAVLQTGQSQIAIL